MTITLTAGAMSREWCDDCLTTAVITFPIYDMQAGGVSLVGAYRACQRCNEQEEA